MPARRLLLDTSSLVYRAFFALPRSITGPHGRPINAAHGYLDMVARLLRERGPAEAVHVLDDDWRPAERVRAYPGYKRERAEEPAELTPQFADVVRVAAAAGMPVAHAPGWEADDAIAALCAEAGPGDALDVVSGDRDLVQLVRDAPPPVRLLFTVKGVSEVQELDEAGAEARFGVPARRYAEYALLRGDPSDGLPGVRGVGEKTARELVARFPDVRAMLAGADTLSGRVGAALARAADYLSAVEPVVALRSDVALVVERGARDDAALERLGEELGLAGPVRRLREALAT